jgi:hypothetical protein
VTPIHGDPLNPGVIYQAPIDELATPLGHLGPSRVSLTFSYYVNTVDQRPRIEDNSLELIDFIFDAAPHAFIQVTESPAELSAALFAAPPSPGRRHSLRSA